MAELPPQHLVGRLIEEAKRGAERAEVEFFPEAARTKKTASQESGNNQGKDRLNIVKRCFECGALTHLCHHCKAKHRGTGK